MKQLIGAMLTAALVPAAAMADDPQLYRSGAYTSGNSGAYQIVTNKDGQATAADSVAGSFAVAGSAQSGSDYLKSMSSFTSGGTIGAVRSAMSTARTVVTFTPNMNASTTTHFLLDAGLSMSGYASPAEAQAIKNGVNPGDLTFYGQNIPTAVFNTGASLQFDWLLRDVSTGTVTTASIYATVGQRMLAYQNADNTIFYATEAPQALGSYTKNVGGVYTTQYFGNPGGGQQLPGGGDTSNPGGGNQGGLPGRIPTGGMQPYFGSDKIGLSDVDFGLAVNYVAGDTYSLDMQLSCTASGESLSSTVLPNASSVCDASHSAYWNGVTGALPQGFSLLGGNGQDYAYSSNMSPSPAAPAGVPELATWAMMLGGFGTVGASLRRRRMVAATL